MEAGVTIAGDMNLNQGYFVGGDVGGDKVEGDQIDARASQGFLNRPTAPVTQHFGAAINLGQRAEALADFDKAIELNPHFAVTHNNRGNAHAAQMKLDEAIADYDKAIHLNPDFANAFWERGLTYRELGKPKEALADFRRYLELQPNAENRAQVEAWIAEAEAELAKLK